MRSSGYCQVIFARVLSPDQHIVNQPGRSYPDCAGNPNRWRHNADRLYLVRIHHLQVVDAHQWRLIQDTQCISANLRRILFSRSNAFFPLFQRSIQKRRNFPLSRIQISIARADGQSVGLSNCRHWNDRDRKIQISGHPANYRKLLHVLLTKISALRLHDIKKLQDHCGYGSKVTRPERATQMVAEARDFGERELGQRIHLAGSRREDKIHAVTAADLDIVRKGSWISLVILVGTELQGIDKNADHAELAFRSRHLDELFVADMEGAHGRNQSDSLARFAPGFQSFSDFFNGVDRPHVHPRYMRARSRLSSRPVARTAWPPVGSGPRMAPSP